MFFSGFFSTHIPYIILAAVYSISLGIYSVYYIKNNILNKEEPVQEFIFEENREITTSDFHFEDYPSHKTDFDNLSPAMSLDLKLRVLSAMKKPLNARVIRIINQWPEFRLYSRPPPAY